AMDRIARAGLRYTQFHSTALCSPTRAALITGRNHHSVGFGVITEMSTGYPRYDSVIGPESATIGTILKQNGYATSWFGKNHNTPSYQLSLAGPYDQWPSGMGFDHFYGFMGGETDQWTPFLFRDKTQVFPWVGKPGYNLTTDMADEAINYIKGLNNAAPDKPFFLYYVPAGSHAPHQPTPEWIKKISDMHLFDQGWELSLRCCICDGEWAFRRDALSLGVVRHQDKTARRQGKKRAKGYHCRLPGEVLTSPVGCMAQRAFNMVAPLSRASPPQKWQRSLGSNAETWLGAPG